jgi:hypothetical protein
MAEPGWRKRAASARTVLEELDAAYDRLRADLKNASRRRADGEVQRVSRSHAEAVARDVVRYVNEAAERLERRDTGNGG